MYEVTYQPQAKRELFGLPTSVRRRVVAAIGGLAADPRPPGCRKLAGSDLYRIRVGQYRVVYGIRDRRLLVLAGAWRGGTRARTAASERVPVVPPSATG